MEHGELGDWPDRRRRAAREQPGRKQTVHREADENHNHEPAQKKHVHGAGSVMPHEAPPERSVAPEKKVYSSHDRLGTASRAPTARVYDLFQ